MIVTLPLRMLRATPELAPREKLSSLHTSTLIAHLQAGETLPPVQAVGTPEGTYYLYNGYHRLAAVEALGGREIVVEAIAGTYADALLYGARANLGKGDLPRSNEDKRRAVTRVLLLDRCRPWTTDQIASYTGTSQGLVMAQKKRLKDELEAHRGSGMRAALSGLAAEIHDLADRLEYYAPLKLKAGSGEVRGAFHRLRALVEMEDEISHPTG